MRISDWGSDVCSSDLWQPERRLSHLCDAEERSALLGGASLSGAGPTAGESVGRHPRACRQDHDRGESRDRGRGSDYGGKAHIPNEARGDVVRGHADRKSGVVGKGGSVREDRGGRGRIKKKKKNTK